ncbi:hypothetical protein ACFLQM_00090 [Acidobacteriota bacterium]
MRRFFCSLVCCTLLATVQPTFAITPSDDLLIAGAARTRLWVDDLYISNPGTSPVTVDVMWLIRNQANPDPEIRTFNIDPKATLILADVILETFGMSRGNGAFRITSEGGEVIANLIAVAVIEDENGSRTLGSGFEAIPASAATSAGQTTTLMGIVATSRFRTNLFATAGANGVTMELDLLDPWGPVIDTATVTLEPYEPWLSEVTNLWDIDNLLNATAAVRVISGSVVILGSKIDNHQMSQDPTTLEASFGVGAGSLEGTYQFSLYDSLAFASGGNLVIEDGAVAAINGTYANFDKTDDQGEAECPLIFQWGFDLTPTAVESFAEGVEFTDTYPDGGEIAWTVTFTNDGNLGFSGAVDAVGSNFSGVDEGCNGSFPTLLFEGGKDQ